MTFDRNDCDFEKPGRHNRWHLIVHRPTGLIVEFANALSKRELLNAMHSALRERESAAA